MIPRFENGPLTMHRQKFLFIRWRLTPRLPTFIMPTRMFLKGGSPMLRTTPIPHIMVTAGMFFSHFPLVLAIVLAGTWPTTKCD
jgi:hypothetical protein